MGVVGRLDQYASMLATEFDDYSMSENLMTNSQLAATTILNDSGAVTLSTDTTVLSPYGLFEGVLKCVHTTNTGGYFRRGQALSLIAATTYTFSVFFKNGTVSNPYGQNNVSPGPSLAANTFSPSFEEFVTSLKTTIPFPNGWYRQVITFTPTYSSTYNVFFNQAVNQSPIGTYYLYGFQLEVGSTATDYTPTTTTAVSRILPATTNTNITGLGTYYSSGFDENVGFTTFLSANIFAPYDLVYDEFGGTLFGAGQGRYMRQNTDKSVIVYNEIDEISDFRDIVRSGLILDLDAGMNSSYSGSGEIWTDLSGNSNNGTLTNGPTYSSANGGSIVFDGTDDYVDPTGLISSFWQGNWTASFWVNFDTLNTTNGNIDKTLLQHGTPALRQGLHLTQRNTRILFGLFTDDLSGTTILTTGTWYNVVFTLNNTTYAKQIYLNGTLDNSHTGGGAYVGAGNNARIGGTVLGFGLTFDGFMPSCSFYNRILTAAEVSQNYNSLKHRFGL